MNNKQRTDAERFDSIRNRTVVVSDEGDCWAVRLRAANGFISGSWHLKKDLRKAIDAAMKDAACS